jgi:hypothetical protein
MVEARNFLQTHPDQPWGPSAPCIMGTGVLSRGQNGRGVALTTHASGAEVSMSRANPLLPPPPMPAWNVTGRPWPYVPSHDEDEDRQGANENIERWSPSDPDLVSGFSKWRVSVRWVAPRQENCVTWQSASFRSVRQDPPTAALYTRLIRSRDWMEVCQQSRVCEIRVHENLFMWHTENLAAWPTWWTNTYSSIIAVTGTCCL